MSEVIDKKSTENINIINISISGSLKRKLADSAKKEGLSLENLACELISEGLVLRAWEIVEQKKFLAPNSQQNRFKKVNNLQRKNYGNMNQKSNQQDQRQYHQMRTNYSKKNNYEPSRNSSVSSFDPNNTDQASFIEYIRNQEKNH